MSLWSRGGFEGGGEVKLGVKVRNGMGRGGIGEGIGEFIGEEKRGGKE